MNKYVILVDGNFNYVYAKTGNMLLRYRSEEVVAVIDSQQAGKTAQDVLGYGGDIPVVSRFSETIQYKPNILVLGNAPQGGKISKLYRQEIIAAIQTGCKIINGMHTFLNDDPELNELAKKHRVDLVDLRKPPYPPHFPQKTWMKRKTPVLLIVGTDCDTGKMTTGWEIKNRLNSKGYQVEFVGTGQTGILLSGNGVPIDAVVSDFMAGEVEYCINKVDGECDLIVVEGQGAINSMLYSCVTLGLLHGSMPDWLVMTHEPIRKSDVSDYPMIDMAVAFNLHLDLMKPFKQTEFVGINLLTAKQNISEANQSMIDLINRFKLPVTDLVRFGDGDLIDNLARKIDAWN